MKILLVHRQLQKENEELKQLVSEHRSVLEKIMQKYREHVQQLRLMEEKEKLAVQIFNAGLAQVISYLINRKQFNSLSLFLGNPRKIIENSRNGFDYATCN